MTPTTTPSQARTRSTSFTTCRWRMRTPAMTPRAGRSPLGRAASWPTTLTIILSDARLVAANQTKTVNEAALDPSTTPPDLGHGTVTGGTPADPGETVTSPLAVAGATGYVAQSVIGSHGLFQLNADGTYTYTLTSPVTESPASNNSTDTVNGVESFSYTAHDANNNTVTGTITINVIDDVPTAHADTGNVTEGGLLTVGPSGVLANDVAGADGFAAGGGVVGVRAAGVDLTTAVTVGVNTDIAGLHGTLHLLAGGSYTYPSPANNITANATDVFVYTVKDGDGDLSTTTLTINPSHATLVADNQTKTVNEAALDTSTTPPDLGHGTVTGSNPADPGETVTGTLAVAGATGYVAQSVIGTHGLFQLNADGTYTYTLTSPVTESPASNNSTDTVNGVESFSYTAHDANNNTVTGTITINVIDDVPTAHADTGNVTEGGLLTVGPSGVLANDVAGADGFAAGGGVVGVRAAGVDLTTAVTVGVNTDIAGLHGTLHLLADGSYTYQSTAKKITANAPDVFVYTVKDGDGDLSTTTLTINLSDATLVADNQTKTVNEAALDTTTTPPDLGHGRVTGSAPALTTETVTGTLAVVGATGYVAQTLTGTHGLFQLNANGTYTYTLTSPVTESPASNNSTDTVNGVESFSYTAHDANNNTVTGTITINVIDDVPTAHADTGNVTEGGLLTVGPSGVLANDVAGADGFAAGGGVVGVRAAGVDLTTAVTVGVNTDIAGLHGTLHLLADGSYTYQSTANNITANATDVFVYTVKDGDGDLSTTTLTINLSDATLVADNQTKTVNEAALDTSTTPPDLGHGTVTGSNPADPGETVTGTLAVAGATGYVAQSVIGTHGLFQLNADGTYTYTLTSPVTESPASNNSTDTVNGVESFSYTAHDANNNTVTGTITINVIDDVPTAHADTGNVTEGGLLTVGPSGVLANDVAGADGFAAGGGVVGVRAAGVDLTTAVTVGVNTDIAGLHGTLHLLADGSYTYQSTANNITANATDVFVYTVKDGDGDLSTPTLTINLSDATLVADNHTKTVNEAALDTTTTPPDLGHGRVTGSTPADPGETVTGTLAVAGATGYVAQSVIGTHGLFQLNADGTYTYTLTSPVTESPASNNSTDTVNGVESFSYTAHDANNNTVTGTITINVIDDVPTAHADTGNVTEGGLLTVGPSGVLANDVAGADGFAAGGGVVGVRAAGVDLTTAVTVGVNTDIAGLHGTLHLLAGGSYTYPSPANNITANATDVFVYTVKDGDGDLSTTTLTINPSHATLVADNQTKTVNEAALDTSTTPPDLGHGTVTGSNPADPGETVTGTLAVAGATGYVAQSVIGTHGLFQLNADGTYTYTLTSPVTESPASNNSTDTV